MRVTLAVRVTSELMLLTSALFCCSALNDETTDGLGLGEALNQIGDSLLQGGGVDASAGHFVPRDLRVDRVDHVQAGLVHVSLQPVLGSRDLGFQLLFHATEFEQVVDGGVQFRRSAHSVLLS